MPTATADLGRIAARVRRLRAERDWRQQELAEAAGVSGRTIQAIERAESSAYERTYVRIAKAFDVPVEELLGGEES